MSESPLFAAPSALFSPRSPLRIPLSPLSVSAVANRSCPWPPALRPLPSPDKENLNAIEDAIESQNRYFIFQFQEISRRIHLLRLADVQATSAFTMANPASALPHTRLSMPEISDDSESEPDVSILGMAHERVRARESGNRSTAIPRGLNMAPEHLQAHDTSVEDEDEDLETVDDEEEDEGEEHDAEQEVDELTPLIDPATMGLKEISNLGRFTVSSHKQGNGVEELRNDDLNMYWQSDGPQPHNLTVYFVKRVEIRDLRFYVNYTDDESYTPTKIIFKSGTSENSLIEFAHMTLDQPLGWQQVSINGAGGGPDGNTLVSYVLQMQILENHQNGKDTHLRGIKIYAFDADSTQGPGRENNPIDDMVEFIDGSAAARSGPEGEKERLSGLARRLADTTMESGEAGLSIPDFMREPEIR